jgi:2OG-Fe(II) oxygenase superfamily
MRILEKKSRFFTVTKAHDLSQSQNVLVDIFTGQLAGAEFTNFLNKNQCAALVTALEEHSMDESYLSGNARKILESQHNRASDPPAYFAGVTSHPLVRDARYMYATASIRNLLSLAGTEVRVAEHHKYGMYCPSIIREFHSTLKLHNDFAAREARGWFPIQHVKKQWAVVVKLTTAIGGETVLYDRKWSNEDEKYFNHKDGYSYNPVIVTEAESAIIKGREGSLILFDCTRYHEVWPVISGKRYTLGAFVGLLPDGQLVIWS